MRRYFISPLITEQTTHGTVTRPLIAKLIDDLGLAPSQGQFITQVMPLDGDPQNRCLVLVDVPNLLPLIADGRFDDLPDFPLDGKVNAINVVAKNRIKNRLTSRGFNSTLIDDLFEKGDGYRGVIEGLARTIQPSFNSNNFDIPA